MATPVVEPKFTRLTTGALPGAEGPVFNVVRVFVAGLLMQMTCFLSGEALSYLNYQHNVALNRCAAVCVLAGRQRVLRRSTRAGGGGEECRPSVQD